MSWEQSAFKDTIAPKVKSSLRSDGPFNFQAALWGPPQGQTKIGLLAAPAICIEGAWLPAYSARSFTGDVYRWFTGSISSRTDTCTYGLQRPQRLEPFHSTRCVFFGASEFANVYEAGSGFTFTPWPMHICCPSSACWDAANSEHRGIPRPARILCGLRNPKLHDPETSIHSSLYEFDTASTV